MSRIMLRELPAEIIVEILARVSVKPLFRWKCVCKSWFNLISNNLQFAKLHLHYAKLDTSVNRNKMFLFCSPLPFIDEHASCTHNNLVTRDLRFPIIDVQPTTEFAILGSCNGLIAACWNDDPLDNLHIIVWNPTTGHFRDLPAITSTSRIINMFYGFGYDSHSDDYKIVRGLVSTCRKKVRLEVLSLKACEWRVSQDVHSSFTLNINRAFNSSSNGFHHWLVELPDRKLGIVSLDLGEEKFLKMVPVPADITNRLSGLKLRGVGDDVWVSKNSLYPTDYLEGWMMKRDGSKISWTKLYSFSKLTVPSLIKLSKWRAEVIWVGIDGKVLINWYGFDLILYDPDEQTSSETGLMGNGCNYPVTYMETLVSPNAI
ncbi:F-box family protein [Euphorbia peplus]|nr:F-box family protein [Euphorbia peplus]